MQLRSLSTPVVPSLFFSHSPITTAPTLRCSRWSSPPHLLVLFLLQLITNLSLTFWVLRLQSEETLATLVKKPFEELDPHSSLEGLITSSASFDLDEFNNAESLIKSLYKHKDSMSGLQTAPSFSIYTTEDGFAAEEDEMEEVEREKFVTSSERSVTIGESMEEKGSGEFSFEKKGIGLIPEDVEEEEKEVLNEFQELGIEEVQAVSRPPLYLAAGLGMYGDNVGGDGGVFSVGFDGDAEENYQRMVGEDPSNPLFLKNYAQLLQSKGDVHGAEEYFFRATLADPNDGEIQLSYAKFLWELYRDQDRALIYFEQAAHTAPKDSHVLAAVACFLWEVDEDEEEDCAQNDCAQIEEDRGEYYKRMVEENPCNPLFLGNYAHFLYQSKGDLLGAEEYYSRAIVADPSDGEMISKYATLVWELHRDHHKAMSYFERAIQATPEDTHVLAAYANFLWETEDDQEEDEAVQDHDQVPIFLGAMTSINA